LFSLYIFYFQANGHFHSYNVPIHRRSSSSSTGFINETRQQPSLAFNSALDSAKRSSTVLPYNNVNYLQSVGDSDSLTRELHRKIGEISILKADDISVPVTKFKPIYNN
jgi:hypothetical protein